MLCFALLFIDIGRNLRRIGYASWTCVWRDLTGLGRTAPIELESAAGAQRSRADARDKAPVQVALTLQQHFVLDFFVTFVPGLTMRLVGNFVPPQIVVHDVHGFSSPFLLLASVRGGKFASGPRRRTQAQPVQSRSQVDDITLVAAILVEALEHVVVKVGAEGAAASVAALRPITPNYNAQVIARLTQE